MAIATGTITFTCIDLNECNTLFPQLQGDPKYSNVVQDLSNLKITATLTDSP